MVFRILRGIYSFSRLYNDKMCIRDSSSSITVPKVETGYSVSMGADQQVAAGQQVRIPVTVASGEKGITGFNAYDMTFTYDPAALTLNTKTGAAANLTVEDNNCLLYTSRGIQNEEKEVMSKPFAACYSGAACTRYVSHGFYPGLCAY